MELSQIELFQDLKQDELKKLKISPAKKSIKMGQ